MNSTQQSKQSRAAIWYLMILLAGVWVGLVVWWVVADGPIAEPSTLPWPAERGIVFVGVEEIGSRGLERPEAEKREFRDTYEHVVFRLTPMRWTPKALEQADPLTLEARCYDHWNPLHPALAVERGELFVADGTAIQHRRPFSKPGVLSTGRTKRWPTSMTAHNGVVYVGSVGQVTAVDFNDGGRTQVLYTDSKMDPFAAWAKPVDFFLRVRDRLVAIDNVIVPKFAFVFERDASGAMTFRYRDDLPEGANEQVMHGAVLDNAMLLTTWYGHRGGAGRCLYRCEVGPDAIASKEILAVHHAASWTGIGVVGDRVLLGGRARGIVVLDPNAPDEGTTVAVGGACDALLVVGETVLALVNEGQGAREDQDTKPGQGSYSRVVAYRWDATRRTLERIREDRLTMKLLRIVR